MSIIIGIDLGTTTSEIAFLKNGKPEIIPNIMGKRITPSVVGINQEGKIIVGDVAKNQLTLFPERTREEVKREMGTNEKLSLGENNYLPQEISAMLLKYLKDSAEEYLGEKVTEAVITVPANFDNLKRQATKDAGEIAGLKVERIINEPTAAALAYGINNMEEDGKILIYDLGGGTFDVTVLEMFAGILDVKSSRGVDKLGGKDFDERIMEYIYSEFKNKYGFDVIENTKDNSEKLICKGRIKEAAEKAKIELSTEVETQITVNFISIDKNGKPINFKSKLTRNKFEDITKDLLKKSEETIEEAINAAGIKNEDITIVLPVGGSSRMYCVKELLKKKFGDKIKTGINPDEAVALGAAVQAGIKSGEIDSEEGIMITDVCSQTLGTSILGNLGNGMVLPGIFDPLIEKDTKIPYTTQKVYNTATENQESVTIEVYEGDNPLVRDNKLIGDFELSGIPKGEAGKEEIEIEFSYDINQILQVKATIISTGKSVKETYNMTTMSEDEKNKLKEVLKNKWKNSSFAGEIKSTIEIAESKVKKANPEQKEKIEKLIKNLKKAAVDEDKESIKKYDDELTDILFDL